MELELEELKSSVEAGVKEEKGLLTPDNIVKEFALVQNKKQH